MTDQPPNTADRIRHELLTIRQCWPHMVNHHPRATLAGTIGRNANSATQPGPIPVHTLDTRRETLTRLTGWAHVVIEDRDLNTTINGSDTYALCAFLDTHADWLAKHEAADDMLEELADSAHKCERIAEPPAALEFVGRCEICQGDLRSRGGRALCRDCGNTVDAEATREQLVTQAENRIMSATEIITLAPRLWPEARITHVHVSRWVKRGDLDSPGNVICDDGAMRPGYRVSDVARLAARHVTRRAS